MKKKFDPHQELDVPKHASKEEINRAFRRRSRQTHPDTAGGNNEAFLRTKRAHLLLTDPAARERWERTGDERPPRDDAARADGELAGMWVDAIAQLGPLAHEEDVKKVMRDNLLGALGDLLKAREKQKEQAQFFRAAAERVTIKGGKPNLAREMLLEKAMAHERAADEKEAKRVLGQAMLELLADYDWRCDQKTEDLESVLNAMRVGMNVMVKPRKQP